MNKSAAKKPTKKKPNSNPEPEAVPSGGSSAEPAVRLARIGFDAYGNHPCEQGPWKTFDGRPMPRWPELAGDVGALTRERWVSAALAIETEVRHQSAPEPSELVELVVSNMTYRQEFLLLLERFERFEPVASMLDTAMGIFLEQSLPLDCVEALKARDDDATGSNTYTVLELVKGAVVAQLRAPTPTPTITMVAALSEEEIPALLVELARGKLRTDKLELLRRKASEPGFFEWLFSQLPAPQPEATRPPLMSDAAAENLAPVILKRLRQGGVEQVSPETGKVTFAALCAVVDQRARTVEFLNVWHQAAGCVTLDFRRAEEWLTEDGRLTEASMCAKLAGYARPKS
jgi:hypothetical protein